MPRRSCDATPGRRRAARTKSGKQIVEAVVAGAEDVLARDGQGAFTITRIAERSGVGPGSIYQYFDSKLGVLGEVARRIEQRALQMARERMAETPGPPSVRHAIRVFVDTLLRPELGDPAVRRAVHLEVPPGWFQRTADEVDAKVHSVVGELLERAGSEVREGDRALMAFVVSHAVEAVVEAAVASRPELLADPEFREELCRLATAYLGRMDAEP